MISWRTTPCIFGAERLVGDDDVDARPCSPSAADATASSLSAVITAPSRASGMPASGAVTRNLSASSVACIRLLRISSGLPTRGRSRGLARTVARKPWSTAAIGRRRRPARAVAAIRRHRAVARLGSRVEPDLARRQRVVALARPAGCARGVWKRARRLAQLGRAAPTAAARASLKRRAAAGDRCAGCPPSGRLCARFVPAP